MPARLGAVAFFDLAAAHASVRDPILAGLAALIEDCSLERTVVEDRASIGSGAAVLGGLTIGRGALVGAGAVVTRDVRARRDRSWESGAPARLARPPGGKAIPPRD